MLPKTAKAGKHHLKLVMNDRQSDKMGNASIAFEVRWQLTVDQFPGGACGRTSPSPSATQARFSRYQRTVSFEAGRQIDARAPAEAANLGRVECIPRVVTRPIGDVRDQLAHSAPCGSCGCCRSTSSQICRTSSSFVRSTPLATLNDFARLSLLKHDADRPAQVLAEEPVARLPAVAVDRQRPALEPR